MGTFVGLLGEVFWGRRRRDSGSWAPGIFWLEEGFWGVGVQGFPAGAFKEFRV